MITLTVECPCCWGEVPVTDGVATAICPNCRTVWSVEFDGDMDAEGRLRDASYLHSPVIIGCTVHRLRGSVPEYRVTFADGSHSNIRYSRAGWEADRWRAGVQEVARRGGYASLTDAIAAVRPTTNTGSGIRCACGTTNHATGESLTHCRLCGEDLESEASQTARAIAALGRCVECGIRPRTSAEGYCEVCDPPLPPPKPMLADFDGPFLPDDEQGDA